MVGIVYRIRRTIELNGETFRAGGTDHVGIFGIISSGVAKRYAPPAAVDAAARPIWMIIVRDDDTTSETDTISWNGRTLSILAIVGRRLRGMTLCKVIVAHS